MKPLKNMILVLSGRQGLIRLQRPNFLLILLDNTQVCTRIYIIERDIVSRNKDGPNFA